MALSPPYILQIDLEFRNVRFLGEMKTDVVEDDPLKNVTFTSCSWRAERLKREDSNHSPFFLNLPKRNGKDHLIFPPELSVPMEMITTHGNATSGYKWIKSSRRARANQKLNSYLVRRLQDSNPGHIDSNARHKYWLFTPYFPCIAFFCSNKSNVLPQVTLFSCVNEHAVFLMRKQAGQRSIIFSTHAAS